VAQGQPGGVVPAGDRAARPEHQLGLRPALAARQPHRILAGRHAARASRCSWPARSRCKHQAILVGGAFRANSGGPTSYLGSHFLYGFDESFILPRGSGERLPWNFRIDGNIGYTKRISKDVAITVTMDVFNVANFQQVTPIDQRYTQADVVPIKGGTLADLKPG
jgi:hypothetical protein